MNSSVVKDGVTKAPHRALLKSLGLIDEEMNKPFIGIAGSFNETIPGHKHMRSLIDEIKAGIRLAGGVPFEFDVIGVCDGLAMNHSGMSYSLASRQNICDSIVLQAKGFAFDGMVFLPNCDKIVPGMLLAGAKLNLPSIFVSGGPMLKGKVDGRYIGLSEMFEAVGKRVSNVIDDCKLLEYENNACPTCGSCSGMYTANTMNCLCEALGIALPYNGTTPAVFSKRNRLAKESGVQILKLVENNVRFKDIVNENSLKNAINCDMAMGGSTNSILHLMALAKYLNLEFDLETFNNISKNTKQIVKLSPANSYFIEDFDEVGGIQTLINELNKQGLIIPNQTVNLIDCVTRANIVAKEIDNDVIRDFSNPYLDNGGLMILRGNIATEGAVVKVGAIKTMVNAFTGVAYVFENEEDSMTFLTKEDIKTNTVVVIRNVGPKSGKGMPEMLSPTSIIKGRGLDDIVALITDGRFSGGSNGMVVGHICPEACENGAIGKIKDKDIIEINFEKQELNVINVDLNTRENNPKFSKTDDYLSLYSKVCENASNGAVVIY
ncbi:MAG: dihydroxy-acid dehydratase [Lachnospirales bacterium]